MATNNRLFYAIEQVAIAPLGTTNFAGFELHGVQSLGIDTNFNLDSVFELGQISLYEDVENLPDVSVTLSKVLDGYPLIYHRATQGAGSATLAGRHNIRSIVVASFFPDGHDASSGNPLSEVHMSGMYVQSLRYEFPVDGNFTESVTLVGNSKYWKTSSFEFTGQFDNTDRPQAISGSGGVNRREDLIYAGNSGTLLPPSIDGIDPSGYNIDTNGKFAAHVQRITCSVDLSRDELLELGRKAPYFRFAPFPVEVTTEIEVLTSRGDMIDAFDDRDNLVEEQIVIVTREGTKINLGKKNKLVSTSFGGGDAGGGNATVTYTYRNFNDMTVTHPFDPTTTLAQ